MPWLLKMPKQQTFQNDVTRSCVMFCVHSVSTRDRIGPVVTLLVTSHVFAVHVLCHMWKLNVAEPMHHKQVAWLRRSGCEARMHYIHVGTSESLSRKVSRAQMSSDSPQVVCKNLGVLYKQVNSAPWLNQWLLEKVSNFGLLDNLSWAVSGTVETPMWSFTCTTTSGPGIQPVHIFCWCTGLRWNLRLRTATDEVDTSWTADHELLYG